MEKKKVLITLFGDLLYNKDVFLVESLLSRCLIN